MITQTSFRQRAGLAALLIAGICAPSLAMAGIGVSIDLGGGPAYAPPPPPPPEYIAPGYYRPAYGPEYVPDYYDYHHRPRPRPRPIYRGRPHGDDRGGHRR